MGNVKFSNITSVKINNKDTHVRYIWKGRMMKGRLVLLLERKIRKFLKRWVKRQAASYRPHHVCGPPFSILSPPNDTQFYPTSASNLF